jgi:hypothetical protein
MAYQLDQSSNNIVGQNNEERKQWTWDTWREEVETTSRKAQIEGIFSRTTRLACFRCFLVSRVAVPSHL